MQKPFHHRTTIRIQKKNDSEPAKKKLKSAVDDLPPCPYGASCYRKNIIHFAEYSHPVKSVGQIELAKQKTAGEASEDKDKKDKKDGKSDWITGDADDEDGPQLQRSYSSMSEEEKIKMIEEAFKLKKELKEKEKNYSKAPRGSTQNEKKIRKWDNA